MWAEKTSPLALIAHYIFCPRSLDDAALLVRATLEGLKRHDPPLAATSAMELHSYEQVLEALGLKGIWCAGIAIIATASRLQRGAPLTTRELSQCAGKVEADRSLERAGRGLPF